MHIKTIVAGAAIALAATIGSASAAEQFSTLKGIPAVAMAPAEADAIRGLNVQVIRPTVTGLSEIHTPAAIEPHAVFGLTTGDVASGVVDCHNC